MKVLIAGSGGREHAIAWKVSRDSAAPELYCAPGNAGTARIGRNIPVPADDVDGLAAWAEEHQPDLTIVGPEAPLCAGLTDRLESLGLRVFGPVAAAAQLEASKAFAKDIMREGNIPTAEADVFEDPESARRYIREKGAPIVVKADGLAAGKGVTVCETVEQAEAAVDEAMRERRFGDAGRSVVIEECLEGPEASILALVDGERAVLLATSQDHKRAYDGDRGPNTGGMGAYSPAPVITPELEPLIRDRVIHAAVRALQARGITYRGVLYAGLMLTDEGPKVLEFNCRFGDPETQAVLMRWDGDILPALDACARGALRPDMVRWKSEHAVCVVMAAAGYPDTYPKGDVIEGLDAAEDDPRVQVFHAGTAEHDGRIVTAGGRVLGVTARGRDLRDAVDRVYGAVHKITFNGAEYRTDIAHRAL